MIPQAPPLARLAPLFVLPMLVLAPVARAAVVPPEQAAAAVEKDVTQGALRIVEDGGKIVECPLKHTDVKAEVTGFIARVKVTQTFVNPSKEKIEAIYVFPLPHEAAVDDMTMVIGTRKIVGKIKKRADARAIYEQALLSGQTAALLEQERPNIFTQSVGNIEPGQEVKIEISYVDVLKYDVGTYEFHFPMVVGPRYNPGTPSGAPANPQPKELEGKVAPPAVNTDRVPDAARINPPVLKPEFRNGHDISLSLTLNAGVPIQNLITPNHRTEIQKQGDRGARMWIAPTDKLPNKDFVLRYGVVGARPEMAMLGHTGAYSLDAKRAGEGYFMLMVQPKEDERLTKSPPREIVFLIDVSGSMSGQPTDKCKQIMRHMLKLCRAQDTVQVMTFASDAKKLFEKALPVTEDNIGRALAFTEAQQGGGGTEMLKGVKLAIDDPLDKERVRIVVMLTDGYIGNEAEIIEHVGKNCGDQVRFWCVGIGASPNMFLVDGVAKQGGGMGKRLGLEDDSVGMAQEIVSRIQRAQLAKVKIDWGGLNVSETFPAKIPELWAGRPIIVYGRYAGGGAGKITVKGSIEGEAAEWPLAVTLPEKEPGHEVLAKVWARQKIEDLMQQTYYSGSPEVEEAVTALALDYRLMSQYTSFVAVDESKAAQTPDPANRPRQMLVPVPLPEGVSYEGIYGPEGGELGDRDNMVLFLGGLKAAEGDRLSDKKALRSEVSKLEKSLERSYRYKKDQAAEYAGRSGGRRGRADESLGKYKGGYLANGRGLQQQGQWGAMPGKTRAFAAATPGPAAPMNHPHAKQPGLPAQDALKRLATKEVEQAVDGLAAVEELYEEKQHNTGAQAAFKAAQEAEKAGQLETARAAFVRAYFLDMAGANLGMTSGDVADQALAAIEALDAKTLAARIKALPALTKRLDLVLSDKTPAEALAEIAKASGLTMGVTDGSLADVAALLPGRDLKITYLDLRRATVAEALDFVLLPRRLEWSLDGEKIVVQTSRRREAVTPWVYDVGVIATPTAEELGKDQQKFHEIAKAASAKFLAVCRAELKADAESVVWFGPGQVLVFGSAKTHAAASDLFANLAKGTDSANAETKALAKVTAARAKARADLAAKQQAARGLLETAAIHEQFGWELLAAASGGKLNDEALTELTLAWKRPETAKLVASEAAGLMIRSAWMLSEASRALPQEKALAELAKEALAQIQPAAEKALADFTAKPEEGSAGVALYAGLALRDNAAFRQQTLAALAKAPAESLTLALAPALLGDAPAGERARLAKLLAEKKDSIAGSDWVVLTAMACRRAGGDAWDTFRAQQRDLTEQPLTGSAVVIINRLASPIWTWLAAK